MHWYRYPRYSLPCPYLKLYYNNITYKDTLQWNPPTELHWGSLQNMYDIGQFWFLYVINYKKQMVLCCFWLGGVHYEKYFYSKSFSIMYLSLRSKNYNLFQMSYILTICQLFFKHFCINCTLTKKIWFLHKVVWPTQQGWFFHVLF